MRKKVLLLFFLAIIIARTPTTAQGLAARYGLKAIVDIKTYKFLCQEDSNACLVDLKRLIPQLVLDIKYASDQNFMQQVMYKRAAAFLRRPAAEALQKVQSALLKEGLGLIVYDAYRPYSVTVAFYEKAKDTTFVASPWRGSRHNRGCAVDVGIIDLRTGRLLEMPTAFDSFTAKAHAQYSHLPANVIRNRTRLQSVMVKYGFMIYPEEWWHFDYAGWADYELLDIPLEDL